MNNLGDNFKPNTNPFAWTEFLADGVAVLCVDGCPPWIDDSPELRALCQRPEIIAKADSLDNE